MPKIKFIHRKPESDRVHYITEKDVLVVLNRLPKDLWSALREIHFNDMGFRGIKNARLSPGYAVIGDRKKFSISICALPPRVSMSKFCIRKVSPRTFGAKRGKQWPRLAVRRFLLYDTFLHELGHLQLINPKAQSKRRKFASESKAQEFADYWRKQLWSKDFKHPDAVHNPPTKKELDALDEDKGSLVQEFVTLDIKSLEKWIEQNPEKFSWKIHNMLRHHYLDRDEQKSMEHIEIILQHSCLDDYILNILSGWQIDKDIQRAIVNLLQWVTKYPALHCLKAACWIKSGDLYHELKDNTLSKFYYKKVITLQNDISNIFSTCFYLGVRRPGAAFVLVAV